MLLKRQKMSDEVIFTLLYLLVCACIIYPPTELTAAGFTIPALFSNYIKCEEEKFITFHIKTSLVTLFVYATLPLSYIILLFLLGYVQELTESYMNGSLMWKIFFTTSIILPLSALYQIKVWSNNNYENHPIARNLAKFCNNNMTWQSVASDIDIEIRRIDKICIQTSSISKIIATENWILKTAPFTIFAAHQSDTSLTVKEANNYRMSPQQNSGEIQYLNIEVKCCRDNVEPFTIRINANDFKDLQDRITRTITILPNVKFHKSIMDRFIDVFKETVGHNPVYNTNQEIEQCAGCLQALSSIKLQKLCEDTGQNNCSTCYCRPMWCLDCIAKWFASRLNAEQQSEWLSSKCTCPMCRATFCTLDVSMLNTVNSED